MQIKINSTDHVLEVVEHLDDEGRTFKSLEPRVFLDSGITVEDQIKLVSAKNAESSAPKFGYAIVPSGFHRNRN